MFELMDVETEVLVAKLITSGDVSMSVFEDISRPIEGLACILDDPEIEQGNKRHIQEVVQDTHMLFVVVSVAHPQEIEIALKISEVAHSLNILTIIVALTPVCRDLTEPRTGEYKARVLL